MTGIENLDEIHMLEMRVDTSETSLGNFGAHVPNLSKLKLSNSIISSVRYFCYSHQSLSSDCDAVSWVTRRVSVIKETCATHLQRSFSRTSGKNQGEPANSAKSG